MKEISITPLEIAKAINDLIIKNEKLQQRINKAIHLINHNDIMHYSVFEKELLEILLGDSNE